MTYEFRRRRMVEFAETDMAGIMHFSRYFPIMEETEHAFFRSLGLKIVDPESKVGWPRVQATIDYKKPLRYEDWLDLQLIIRRLSEKSIEYEILFRREGSPEVHAIGKMIVVAVRADETGRMRSLPIPQEIRSKLSQAPT